MNAYTPSTASRIATAISGLALLAVLGGALMFVHGWVPLPGDESSATDDRGEVEIQDAHDRPTTAPSGADAEPDLPMRAPVRTSAEHEEWARTSGQTMLAGQAPLSPHNEIMLGRFLAIQPLVFQEADQFGLDPLWFFQVLASESALDPLAQGPEAGDRGLGQVSFESERTAAKWASDPTSPYYVAEFDPAGSIWDPRRNLVLSAIVLRSLYAMPDVTSHEQAYARYTQGLAAVEGSEIADRTMPRVERSRGYAGTFQTFLALAYADPDSSMPIMVSGLVRELLQTVTDHEPGWERYQALRQLYLAAGDAAHHDSPWASPWRTVLCMGEALTFARLSEHLTREDTGAEVTQIHLALRESLPAIEATSDARLIHEAHRVLLAVETASNNGARNNEIHRADEQLRRDVPSEVHR